MLDRYRGTDGLVQSPDYTGDDGIRLGIWSDGAT